MLDLSDVSTVELLTRAADLADKAAEAADWGREAGVGWYAPGRLPAVTNYVRPVEDRLIVASGPDHWRTVEATFRAILAEHSRITVYSDSRQMDSARVCKTCGGSDAFYEQSGTPAMRMAAHPCRTLQSLRPLAEQVLRDLEAGR